MFATLKLWKMVTYVRQDGRLTGYDITAITRIDIIEMAVSKADYPTYGS